MYDEGRVTHYPGILQYMRVLFEDTSNIEYKSMCLTIQNVLVFNASLVSVPLSNLIALKFQPMKREKYHFA